MIRQKIREIVKDDEVDPELVGDLPGLLDDEVFEEEDNQVVETMDPDATKPDADDFTPESYDRFLTANVLLPQGDELTKATVVGRKRDQDGRPTGKLNLNPLLDTRLYEVQFSDGSTEEIATNLIAETLLSKVDDEGRSYSILKEIVDHRTNGHALSKDNAYVIDYQETAICKYWTS